MNIAVGKCVTLLHRQNRLALDIRGFVLGSKTPQDVSPGAKAPVTSGVGDRQTLKLPLSLAAKHSR
jgi:hypothetical protein